MAEQAALLDDATWTERWRWLAWPVGLYVGLRLFFLGALALLDPNFG